LARLAQRYAERQKRAALEYVRLMGEATTMAQEHRVFGVTKAVERDLDRHLAVLTRARRNQTMIERVTPYLYQSVGLAAILLGLALASRFDSGNIAVIGGLVLLMVRSLSYGQTFQSTYHSFRAAEPFVRGLVDAIRRYEQSHTEEGPAPLLKVE